MPEQETPQGPPITAEIGSSGLRHSHGFVREEFDPELRGRRGAEKFREMRDNSAPVGAALHAIETTVRKVGIEVEPYKPPDGGATAEDEERAAFVDSCFHDMSFSFADTRSEALTMLPQGYAYCEIVYKRRNGPQERGVQSSKQADGRVGWAKVALRAQETIVQWDLDAHGGIHGAWQQAPPTHRRVYLPIAKALLFRVSKERNNPEGRSILRNAYWPWFQSKRLIESVLIGAYRDLAGFPVVRVPGKIMAADAAEAEKKVYESYKELVRSIHRDGEEGAVLPSDRPEGGQHYYYDLQLLATGGRRQFDIPGLVSMFDRWIATGMRADLLMMGHEAVGSFALAKGKTSLLHDSIEAYFDAIDSTFNQHAIPRLMRLNGWPADRCPRLKHKPLANADLAALADYLSKLAAAGMRLFPDERLENHLRREARLPPRADGPEPEPSPEPTERKRQPPEELL